jgi:hypothetical protein
VLQDVLDGDPVGRSKSEAPSDQVLALVSESGSELEVCVADLLILLEGDVAADHVVEEDAQAPDGKPVSPVSPELDPLWRSVHSGT